MEDKVLVTTHDLSVAGVVREAFASDDLAVEFITPGEPIQSQSEAVLLVLSGVPEDARIPKLTAQARRELGIPVFAIVGDDPDNVARARALDPDELFTTPLDPALLLLLGKRTIDRRRLQQLTGIVGNSNEIREALERVVQIAPVNSTVLVDGESGTGKELVARGIHLLSSRRHQPFLAVNVAALPETLLESELFGHAKGAFTGAIDSRKGFFELADKGTIFLDEVGEMPLATQTKLLRVLEHREFLRIGAEVTTRVDVRIIAATNRDLRKEVALGEFRRDLYYRLNVLSITLPPLRERKGDIPLLVREFIQEITAEYDRPFVGISPEAMQILQNHTWPGNVRELRNLVESMVVLAPGREIRPEDIPEPVRNSGGASLPVLRPRVEPDVGGEPTLRPELEFIFRTLVDLRVDMDELKREFERYRADANPAPGFPASGPALQSGGSSTAHEIVIDPAPLPNSGSSPRTSAGPPPPARGNGNVVFEPGMTMEEMERRAIELALQRSGGNRRKAAEDLGIGERTLYRKIQKFDLEM